MRSIALISLLLFSYNLIAQTTVYIDVTPGDLDELRNAITVAGEQGPEEIQTLIRSSGTFIINDLGLPDIKSTVTIQGFPGPIIFDGQSVSSVKLIGVDKGATLRLINVEIAEFILGFNIPALIQNKGILHLNQIQIRNVSGTLFCMSHSCVRPMPVIGNEEGAELFLNQVSLIYLKDLSTTSDSDGILIRHSSGNFIRNSGEATIVNTQVYRPPPYTPIFNNYGTMTLNFTSLYARLRGQTMLGGSRSAITKISNSVVAGFSSDWCSSTQSLGYNLIEDADCSFNTEGDKTGVVPGLFWRPVEASWGKGNKQILTHALVPMQASPAIDMIPRGECIPGDLLQNDFAFIDGNGDHISLCDAGAVELVPSTLGEGGINGIYYNPDADGHYIYILDNNYNTVVLWSTFDNDGNQAWIFGIGELVNGRSLIADAYINTGGRVSLDGEIEQAEANRWGTLEVEMSNCKEGFFSFKSDQPEFGSGQIQISRVASVRQLGCVEE